MPDETIRIVVEGQDKASATLTNVAHAMQAIQGGIQLARQAYQLYDSTLGEAIRTTQKYAAQVRDLSAISGQSAENTSRFIQVLDDYEISAEDATTATRTLTRQGLAPNLETLAKLSDEYLAANTAQEKNAIILKNLGRAGLQWTNVLKQGSAALLAQGAAVRASLILDEEAIRKTEEYRLAVDDLNDSKQALSVTVGNKVIPTLTQEMTQLSALLSGEKSYGEVLKENIQFFLHYGEGIDSATRSYIAMGDALIRAEEISEDSLGGMAEDLQDVYKNLDPLQAAFDEFKEKGTAGWLELRKSIQLNTLSLLEHKMMMDGQLGPTEKAILEGLRKEWGLLDESTQTANEAIQGFTDRIAAGGADALVAMRELQEFINSMHGKTINININTNISGEGAGQSPYNPPAPTPPGGGGSPTPHMATGGQLSGRNWTLVGDAPGGRLTPYSELISPTGRVYSAPQTRGMLASGLVPRSAANGSMLGAGGMGPTDDWMQSLSRMLARAVRDAMQQANI